MSINTDFTYCSISHICPKRNTCKRHLSVKKIKAALWWVTPNNKTEKDFTECKEFVPKN